MVIINSHEILTSKRKITWNKILFYVGLINIFFAILITIINVFTNRDYSSELVSFILFMAITLGIVILLNLGLSIIPSIIGSVRYHWSDEKQARIFFKSFLFSTSLLVGGSCILLFFLYFPSFTILASEDIIYAIWWYGSFTIVVLFLFLLYVYNVYAGTKQ